MKTCSKCKIDKPFTEYYKYSRIDGYQCYCKSCKKQILKDYKEKRTKRKVTILQKKCTDCNLDLNISNFTKNPLGKDGFNNICKLCKSNKDKVYRKENKEIIGIKKNIIHNNRIKSDILYKLKCRCRTRVYLFFKQQNIKKTKSISKLLGCDIEKLKDHLSSKFKEGMSWDNYGQWHMDHIIPLYQAKTEEEVYKLCHYTNLQPLWASENLKKGKKIL